MVAARRNGTPVADLTTRSWATATSPDLPHPLESLAKG